jgi:hypothetical protein
MVDLMADLSVKVCNKCGIERPLDYFAKEKRYIGGRHHICRICHREHRRKSDNKHRAKRQAAKKIYIAEVGYFNLGDNRKKANCRHYFSVFKRKHNIPKEPCYCCGEERTQAHHENYEYPLQVVWLCTKCHNKVHYDGLKVPKSRIYGKED